jgi:CheY-like chemotaxis protein
VAVNRSLLVDLLASLGFETVDAASGEAALAAAIAERLDVILLDLRMPGMDGFELTRRLRALPNGPRLKIIAMSASVLSFNTDDAFAAGCDDFLPKPFRESDLIAKLGLHLSLHWEREPIAPAPADFPEPPAAGALTADAAVALPALDFGPLLAAAERGEIAALRRLLQELRAAHPHDPRLVELSTIAASYQMERLRERLAAFSRRRLSSTA